MYAVFIPNEPTNQVGEVFQFIQTMNEKHLVFKDHEYRYTLA